MGEVEGLEDENTRARAQQIKTAMCDTKAIANFSPITLGAPDYDEVYPGVFIGDECSARDRSFLRHNEITHIINAAAGKGFGMVHTGLSYYTELNIKYHGIELSDLSVSDASKYFYEAADFIDEALKNNGKVLVHCLMGISRSSTLVIAFLMIRRNMTAVEAVTKVRHHRNVHPNDGFITQLAALDITLEKLRARNSNSL